MFSYDELMNALKKADIVLRPRVLILNPKDKDLILKSVPDIEKNYKLTESEIVQEGTIYVVNRRDIEEV